MKAFQLITLCLFSIFTTFIVTAQPKIYWTNTTGIQRSNLDGSALETLLTNRTVLANTIALDTINGKLYWTDNAKQSILRFNLDGSNLETIINGVLNNPGEIALDLKNKKIYWRSNLQNIHKIERANLDGTAIETVLMDTVNNFFAITIDPIHEKMYWINVDKQRLQRANLNGSSIETLDSFTLDENIVHIRLDAQNGKVYWDNFQFLENKVSIIQANLDGTMAMSVKDIPYDFTQPDAYRDFEINPAAGRLYWMTTSKLNISSLNDASNFQITLPSTYFSDLAYHAGSNELYWIGDGTFSIYKIDFDTNLPYNIQKITNEVIILPDGIAIDTLGGKMYWTDPNNNKIQRANLDGSAIEDLVTTSISYPRAIALDVTAGKMYWTDRGLQGIYRADLNGSNRQTLLANLSLNPEGLALDLPNQKMYFTIQGRTGVNRANLNGSQLEEVVLTFGIIDQLTLDLDNKKIYWSQFSAGIQRSNLDGTNVETVLADSLANDGGIALDLKAGKIYWIKNQLLQRLNLDGSGVENLITTLPAAFGFGGYLTLGATHSYSAGNINATQGLSKLEQLPFKIYPTLAYDQLTIQTENLLTEPVNLRLLDAQGRMVLHRLLNGSSNLDISDLKSGIYLLEFTLKNQRMMSKFIKIK